MSSSPSIADLESAEHLRHQQREWLAERIGWVAIAVILLAAMAGLLGHGPLSHRRHAGVDGLVAAEYDGIGRHHAPARLRIIVANSRPDREIEVSLPRSFLDAVQIEQIVPEPAATRDDGAEVVYSFRAGDAPHGIIVHHQYDQIGTFRHQINSPGKQPVVIRQWVLP